MPEKMRHGAAPARPQRVRTLPGEETAVTSVVGRRGYVLLTLGKASAYGHFASFSTQEDQRLTCGTVSEDVQVLSR